MNSEEKLRAQVLLSIQRALLGAVSSRLRGIACAWDHSRISIKAFFDGEVSEVDKEAMEVACSEVLSDFPEHRVDVESVRLDYPEKLTLSGLNAWVYRRME